MNIEPIKKTRFSYTIKQKLKIVKEFETKNPDGTEKSKSFIAKRYGITCKMLRNWIKDKEKFLSVANSMEKSIYNVIKMRDSLKDVPYRDLEENLVDWILDNNEKGLVFKDKYSQPRKICIPQNLYPAKSKALIYTSPKFAYDFTTAGADSGNSVLSRIFCNLK